MFWKYYCIGNLFIEAIRNEAYIRYSKCTFILVDYHWNLLFFLFVLAYWKVEQRDRYDSTMEWFYVCIFNVEFSTEQMYLERNPNKLSITFFEWKKTTFFSRVYRLMKSHLMLFIEATITIKVNAFERLPTFENDCHYRLVAYKYDIKLFNR